LQLGKVQNLRIAALSIDRRRLEQGWRFSFWAQVGKPSKSRGFVPGRQIQEGCVIPAIAGGICQLSNAIYDCALRAGFEVTERHAHTRSLPSASWAAGRDATVAWNHIDLRFSAPYESMLRAFLTADELVVQILAKSAVEEKTPTTSGESQEACESCETCGMSQCYRHKGINHVHAGTTNAWLVDQVTPEFAQYMAAQGCDALMVPIKGQARYAWPLDAARSVGDARWVALRRAWASRRLAEQGAERQKALVVFDAELAMEFEKRLSFDATHLVVAQTLLPFLWSMGTLGGRTFDVLMTRCTMADIHRSLDEEHARHPERRLLADYRAHEALVDAETQALEAASRIITPHPMIAAQFGERAVLLDWCLPQKKGVERGGFVVFPGPTVARKGAYEVREAMRTLDAPLRYCGSLLEGREFWDGLDATAAGDDWLAGARVVVQPAVLEDQPRRLLRAIAEGVPVIATEACGVSHLDGVATVPVGDEQALRAALVHAIR
jgi:hypothetical protein